MKWEVDILGNKYEVEADENYGAKIAACKLHKEATNSDKPPTYFIPVCHVRRKDDKRVKYDY